MAMSQPWVHCNICMKQDVSPLFISSCGKVVCASCKPSLSSTQCNTCRGPCTRTVELNSKAPKEVLRLFEDPSIQLKSVMKCFEFQNQQKKSLLANCRKSLNDKRKEYQAILKRKERDHALYLSKKKLDEELTIKIQQQKDLKQRLERELQESKRASMNPRNPFVNRSLDESLIPMPEMSDDTMLTPFVTRARASSGPIDYSSFGGRGPEKFLEMKTPAAWHRKTDDFMDIDNPQLGNGKPMRMRHDTSSSSQDGAGGSGGARGGGNFFPPGTKDDMF